MEKCPLMTVNTCRETPRIEQSIDREAPLPQKDDLSSVGALYIGMGTYLCIYKREELYTYWVLGGANGYDCASHQEKFESDTSYPMYSWDELLKEISERFTIIEIVSQEHAYQ